MIKVIDFWAEWCPPCKAIKASLDELENELGIEIERLNADENRDMLKKFGVQSIPTLIILRDDVEVDRIVGATPKAFMKNKFSQAQV